MARPRDEQKTEQIYQAATRLVIRTGFSALRMADIAREAGVATGTLYVYFDSKETLVNELFVVIKREIAGVMLAPGNQKETFYETFRSMWMAYFRFCLRHPEKMLFVEQFLYSGLITDGNIALTNSYFEPLNAFLESAQRQDHIKHVDADVLKAHLQGAIHEIVKHFLGRNDTPGQATLDRLFDLNWNGIRK